MQPNFAVSIGNCILVADRVVALISTAISATKIKPTSVESTLTDKNSRVTCMVLAETTTQL